MRRYYLAPILIILLSACTVATPDPGLAVVQARATLDMADAVQSTAQAKAAAQAEATAKAEAYARQASEAEIALIEARMEEKRLDMEAQEQAKQSTKEAFRATADAQSTATAEADAELARIAAARREAVELDNRRAWTGFVETLPYTCFGTMIILAMAGAAVLVMRQSDRSKEREWELERERLQLQASLIRDMKAGTVYIGQDGTPKLLPSWADVERRERYANLFARPDYEEPGYQVIDAEPDGESAANELAEALAAYIGRDAERRLGEVTFPSRTALGMSGSKWDRLATKLVEAGEIEQRGDGRYRVCGGLSLAHLMWRLMVGAVSLSPTDGVER